MKKWNKPELLSLGVENTFDVDCTCGVVGSIGEASTFKPEKHPCHKTGNGEHNMEGNHTQGVVQNGHILSSGCTVDAHKDKDGNPMCCCYGTKPSGTGNGGIGSLIS